MKTYKTLEHFKQRLAKGIDWGDWIKVQGKEYKMVEYGDGESNEYMLFQNKPTKKMIQVEYKVPCSKWVDGVKVITQTYKFLDAFEYNNDELYRY